ncbi:hypothetical protein B0H15DRAFT_867753 [Mycena belliarum]|uniref:Uncharacterized protein n=1 Tax=Mycena belliarum TaxID=1033014 RepID=A0AAD6TRN7_9AGAR|nr:hypothetical protein B0H15DRAFT_867753 [Mycena belliae]
MSSSESRGASDFGSSESLARSQDHALALLPEPELRALLTKLAVTNARVRRAIARELRRPTHGHSRPKRHKHPREPQPEAICANCHQERTSAIADEPCAFHPGQLEDSVFEFLSRTPEGRPLRIRRTLVMWTCCAEAPQALGCADANAHLWRAE